MTQTASRIEQAETGLSQMLVVDLEPTPYKTDLWNAFSESREAELSVIYTERRNWAPDGGHDYQKWPAYRHEHIVLEGRGAMGGFRSAVVVAWRILSRRVDLVFIAGYVHFAMIVAIACAIVTRQRFVVHADEFNLNMPQGRFPRLKWFARELLRKIIFRFGNAVLVCGRRGVESALQAGCARNKVMDFPYVVDVERMREDEPRNKIEACQADIDQGRHIIFFSGRMIPRKGLPTLLEALSGLQSVEDDWVLWIEGDGPELARYSSLASQLKMSDRCRFLGFCQFDMHSWLIRSSHIVVVPSLEDTWGIVVDEGLQLGKVVVSSDATGSGYDRIEAGHNGYLFPAGDVGALRQILSSIIGDSALCVKLGSIAASGGKNLRPKDNLETLLKLVRPVSSV